MGRVLLILRRSPAPEGTSLASVELVGKVPGTVSLLWHSPGEWSCHQETHSSLSVTPREMPQFHHPDSTVASYNISMYLLQVLE